MSSPPADDAGARRRRWEIGGALGTAVVHLVFQELIGFHGVFVVVAVVAWSSYVYARTRREPDVLARWGFRRENFAPSFIAVSAAGAAGIAGMALIAISRGQLRLHGHMLIAFVLYPIWGTIQQFLVQGLVAANLERTRGPWRQPALISLICAAIFAVVHAPGREIMLGTFLLGCVFTPVYLRWHNLWPLGMYHGWLGILFYFWVRGFNPVARMFGH
jgi:hypothetical protein